MRELRAVHLLQLSLPVMWLAAACHPKFAQLEGHSGCCCRLQLDTDLLNGTWKVFEVTAVTGVWGAAVPFATRAFRCAFKLPSSLLLHCCCPPPTCLQWTT